MQIIQFLHTKNDDCLQQPYQIVINSAIIIVCCLCNYQLLGMKIMLYRNHTDQIFSCYVLLKNLHNYKTVSHEGRCLLLPLNWQSDLLFHSNKTIFMTSVKCLACKVTFKMFTCKNLNLYGIVCSLHGIADWQKNYLLNTANCSL